MTLRVKHASLALAFGVIAVSGLLAQAEARCVAEASRPGQPPVPQSRVVSEHRDPREACAIALKGCEGQLRRAGPAAKGARCEIVSQPRPVKAEAKPGPKSPPKPHGEPSRRGCNVDACARAYRSFRVSDCSYQPYNGPRRRCEK